MSRISEFESFIDLRENDGKEACPSAKGELITKVGRIKICYTVFLPIIISVTAQMKSKKVITDSSRCPREGIEGVISGGRP